MIGSSLFTTSAALLEGSLGSGMLANIWELGMPEAKSNFAPMIDRHYAFINIVNVIFFVPITFFLVYFAVVYKKPAGEKAESDVAHNTPLEVTWSVIPLILVVIMFVMGFNGYNEMRAAPADSYQIHVGAAQWSWEFTYPNGMKTAYDKGVFNEDFSERLVTDPDQGLHLPPGVPIRIVMTSSDVLHSFFIPEFRVKQDIVPGKISSLWFTPDVPVGPEPDMYWLLCTEYCGTSHSEMQSTVWVHPTMESFLEWQKRASSWRDDQTFVERGEILSRRKGCRQCHSVEPDAPGIWTGPTWAGLYGKTGHPVRVGSEKGERIEIDVIGEEGEEYLHESMRNPAAKISEGYGNLMPIKRLSDEELLYLTEYIKSLGGGN